jgi:glycosyltransferase involved in cell wall biosynthesis
MAARVNTFFPDLRPSAARHWHEASSMRVRHVFAPSVWNGEPLRIVTAGWIVETKGRHVICDAARVVRDCKLPLRFHVLGEMELTERDRRDLSGVVTVHGRFPSERFSEMLGAIAPHVAWLPAQVPETWSYVLTDFFEAALPVVATAIGAIPERCLGRPFTWLLSPDSPAQAWVNLFLALRASGLCVPPAWAPVDHLPPTDDIYFDPYLLPARETFANRLADRKAGGNSLDYQPYWGQAR